MSLFRLCLLAGTTCLAAAGAMGQNAGDEAGQPQYYSLASAPEGRMSARDSGLLVRERSAIEAQAHFYSYDLASGDWIATQVFCPVISDYVMMHFKRMYPDGTESLFTAIVPRQEGKVEIVPVYYRSATPFHPAAKSPHNIALFNRIVSPQQALSVSNSGTGWLPYGACYAEMVGGPMSVLLQPGDSARMYTVPPPAVQISLKERLSQIRFSDRISEGRYDYWTIDLDRSGKLHKARYEEHGAPAPKITNAPGPPRSRPSIPLEEQGKITVPADPSQP